MTDLSRLIIPRGFRFGAIKAGVKASGRKDFAIIAADAPAAPQPHLRPTASPPLRSLWINST